MAQRKRSTKLFVLDTNVLLHDPNSLFRFADNDLFISFVTLEELDRHKVGVTDVNRNARQATRLLEQVANQGDDFLKGFPLDSFNGGHAHGRLYFQVRDEEFAVEGFGSKNDNLYLGVITALKRRSPGRPVVLVTKDINLRVKARALGFVAEDYLNDHVVEDAELLHRGYRELDHAFFDRLKHGEVESWTAGGRTHYRVSHPAGAPFALNEGVVMPDGSCYRVAQANETQAHLQSIVDRRSERHAVWGVRARNHEQALALDLLLDPDIDFVTLLGPAGTGKTLLTLAAALELVLERKLHDEIVFTRATIPLGHDIGFLPGTEEEKMNPWMGALEDNLDVLLAGAGEDAWQRSTTRELVRARIKTKSMTFMRGRTFHRRFFIVDEAQNLTPKEMKSLVTRAGEGTKVVAMGNLAQVDTPYLTELSSGLAYAVEHFKGWRHYGHIILERGERSRLSSFANERL